jgi:hypothetical protein
LAVENPKLSVHGQKLSAPVLKNQRVKPFLFLILKTVCAAATTPTPSAPKTLAKAGGVWAACTTATLEKIFLNSKS